MVGPVTLDSHQPGRKNEQAWRSRSMVKHLQTSTLGRTQIGGEAQQHNTILTYSMCVCVLNTHVCWVEVRLKVVLWQYLVNVSNSRRLDPNDALQQYADESLSFSVLPALMLRCSLSQLFSSSLNRIFSMIGSTDCSCEQSFPGLICSVLTLTGIFAHRSLLAYIYGQAWPSSAFGAITLKSKKTKLRLELNWAGEFRLMEQYLNGVGTSHIPVANPQPRSRCWKPLRQATDRIYNK